MSDRFDNFTRADTTNNIGTPSDGGSAWVQGTGIWGISSNQGYTSDGNNGPANLCWLESGDSNVHVEVTISVMDTETGLLARVFDAANLLNLQCYTATTLVLFERVAFTYTQLGIVTIAPANGDVLALRAIDDQLNAYHNGVLKITATSALGQTYTKHGINSCEVPARFQNFSAISVVGTVRAVVSYRDTAGTGGSNAQLLTFRLTFFGDDVPEDVARMLQIQIELSLPNNLSETSVNDAVIEAVTAKATELGLTILESDILIL